MCTPGLKYHSARKSSDPGWYRQPDLQLCALEKEVVQPKYKINKTFLYIYKGFCQVSFLFILPFVTLSQKSEYENSFLLFLVLFLVNTFLT